MHLLGGAKLDPHSFMGTSLMAVAAFASPIELMATQVDS